MTRKTRKVQFSRSETEAVMKPKIVAFVCNWQSQGKKKPIDLTVKPYSADVKFLRVMCVSRIDRALILKCVQEKVDGIFIGICNAETCHYKDGMELARNRFQNTFDFIEALRYDRNRIYVYEDDGTSVNSLPIRLEEFAQEINKMELYQ